MDRILERTAIALEQFVTDINGSRFVDGTAEITVPWSRSPMHFARYEIPHLIFETRNVLRARALFAQSEPPSWALPLPIGDEISPLLRSASAPMCLLGHYACSLMMMSYDYPGHPAFHDYGCGVMAHPGAPDHVRNDPELQAEFSARELPGLSGRLVWFGEGLPAEVRVSLLPAAG